jgi:hypothetical protein
MLVSLGVLAMRRAHNLVARFLRHVMMRLDALGLAIAMALIARMARPADVGGRDDRKLAGSGDPRLDGYLLAARTRR